MTAMHRSICRSAPLALLAVAACAVGPDYAPPSGAALRVPARFAAPVETMVAEADLARWWTLFQDPALDWLVDRALAANLDIDVAGSRVRQARAAARGARAALFPTLGVSGSATRAYRRGGGGTTIITTPGSGTTTTGTGTGTTTTGSGAGGTIITTSGGGDANRFDAGFDASYEADLFGGVRRSIEASRADRQSSEESLHDTQRSVVAEVATDYVAARQAQARLAIARANLAAQDETLRIVGWRVQAGLASALDLEQARQLRAQTSANIPALQSSFTQNANALAILIGEAPGAAAALLDPVRPIPLAPAALAADVPANVIARRPDVRAAERALAAETARIGVEESALYPALQLTGSLGGSGGHIGDIASDAIGTIVGAISAPIFQGGAIRARIESQRAAAGIAYAQYRAAVLTALGDVENALVALAAANRSQVDLAAAAQAAGNARLYAASQYQAGLIDFQGLLDSERTLLSSQDALAASRGDRATALIQLYKALGGGWQAAPQPPSLLAGTSKAPASLLADTSGAPAHALASIPASTARP